MLVLISFVLVLLAAVLLVLGLLADSGLGLIYGSIAASLVAGALLIAAIRVKPKSQGDAAAPDAPSKEPEPVIPPEPARTAPTPAVATPAPVAAPAAAAPAPAAVTVEVAAEEDFFPIADYDELTVAQILPLLPELYADEIGVVRAREQGGQSRAAILNRLEELREQLAGAPADVTAAELAKKAAPAPEKPAPAKAAAKKASPAKKSAGPAKKATPAKKSAGPAKKAAAPTKKAAAPTKKAAAAKSAAPAKKATGKKAATKKAAGAAKKR